MTEPRDASARGATGPHVPSTSGQRRPDTLLFIDNIFPLYPGGSEVSTLLGRMPSAVGYRPTSPRNGRIAERITSTRKAGDIRAAVYVPADDLTDPARPPPLPTWTQPTVLSRPLSELNLSGRRSAGFPSRILSPRIVGQEHYDVAQGVKKILKRYKDLQDIIAILGIDELPKRTKPPWRARARCSASVAAVPRGGVFTGIPGAYVKVADTVRSFKEIIEGKHDSPEQAFYLKGD